MPLLDHFHPPLSRTHPWRGFHGTWAAAIARLLNAGVLPSGYYAIPFLDRDGPVEIDIAAVRDYGASVSDAANGDSLAWSPSTPGQAVAVDWPDADNIGVEIFSEEGDPQLVAAIELVSPSNKDRPKAREAFASKCADYLHRGCGVAVVDVVSTRRADLHNDLLKSLGVGGTEVPGSLSANSYRSVGRNGTGQLLIWPTVLQVGLRLPTIPLWLSSDVSVPLDLEASHALACGDLRIAV